MYVYNELFHVLYQHCVPHVALYMLYEYVMNIRKHKKVLEG